MPRTRNPPQQEASGNHDAPPLANPPPIDTPPESSIPVGAGGEQDRQEGTQERQRPTDVPRGHFHQLIEKIDTTDWVMAMATVIIAVATVVNVFIVGLQWGEMKNTRADTERFFRTDERAWVELGDIKLLPRSQGDKDLSTLAYAINLKNVGKTIARDVKLRVYNGPALPGHRSDADMIKDIQDNKLDTKIYIAATRSKIDMFSEFAPKIIAPNNQTIVPMKVEGFRDDGTRNYIIGRIDYKDAFPVEHWVKFCYFVASGEGDLALCAYGNEEDDKQN